jgi:hypothetical protein
MRWSNSTPWPVWQSLGAVLQLPLEVNVKGSYHGWVCYIGQAQHRFMPLFVCNIKKMRLASQELAKTSFFFYPREHIKPLVSEHTMVEYLQVHTGVDAAGTIKLSALVSSHMHGQCLMCLV